MIGTKDLRNKFSYHPPKDAETVAAYEKLRSAALAFALNIDELVPDGREKALAITNLQQSVMWANAGIACSPDGE
jgi:hypothetical protein